MSPGWMPSLSMVPRDSAAVGPGSSASSTFERRVMAPVCQCSSMRPVVRMKGYSWSGVSSGGMQLRRHQLAEAARAREALVEHHVVAGLVGRSRTDRSPRFSRSTRSQVMLSSDGISEAISV